MRRTSYFTLRCHAREGGHPVNTALSVITGSPPSRGRQAELFRRCRYRYQYRAHVLAAVDNLAIFVRRDVDRVAGQGHLLFTADDHRQLPLENMVDFFRRRSVGPRPATWLEVRDAEDESLRSAHLRAVNTQRFIFAVIRCLVGLCFIEVTDDHQNLLPFSMRNFCLGSRIATRRTMQPSPRSQFQGK